MQTSHRSLVASTKLPEIHLSGSDAAGVFETELRNSKIGGILRDHRPAHACNIIESALESFCAERVDFTRCDFKDNAIRSCHFVDSKFDSNTFAYNAVVGTLFEQCSFNDSDIQQCDFEKTVFLRCDFRNLLVKACTFLQCEFRDCVTNNKVFETCRLSDCAFSGTELQAQSIAENFGVTSSQYDGVLREGRGDASHRKLTKKELAQWAKQFAVHPLQRLSVDYFRNGNLLEGSQILDTCLTVETWVPRSRTAGSFALVLSRWSEFLIWLYERDQLVIHTLLRLHSTTDTLIQALESLGTHTPWISQVRGVHLSLARLVDHYLILLEESVGRIGNKVLLLVEGGSSEEWYRRNLKAFFDRAPDAKICRLVKRNSPWDLSIVISHGSILLFMALFLATRTRLQLLKYGDRFVPQEEPSKTAAPPELIKASPTKSSRPKANVVTRPILSLEFGGQQALRSTPSFRLQAYLPGNLIGDLQLDLSSRHVGKLRKIIKDML
jgi:uncharacterized protein YjbI with pentapeptide repeats